MEAAVPVFIVIIAIPVQHLRHPLDQRTREFTLELTVIHYIVLTIPWRYVEICYKLLENTHI